MDKVVPMKAGETAKDNVDKGKAKKKGAAPEMERKRIGVTRAHIEEDAGKSIHDIAIAGSDGQVVGDVRPLCRLNIACVAEQDGQREIGSCGGGGRASWDWFFEPSDKKQVQLYVELENK